MSSPVVSQASSEAVLVVRVGGPHNRCMHLFIWQICKHGPDTGSCRFRANCRHHLAL